MLAAYTFVICFLLYFVDYDYSIATHQPEILEKARDLVVFWKKLYAVIYCKFLAYTDENVYNALWKDCY